MSGAPLPDPTPSERQRILRREPAAPAVPHRDDEPKTSIIRRHPTGPLPPAREEPPTGLIARPADNDPHTSLIARGGAQEPPTGLIGRPADDEAPTGYIPRAKPVTIPRTPAGADPGTAIAAAVVTILSGWATAVIATDLITGWWHTDRLFCVAVGFLTAISAAASIGGLIMLLLRRRMGRLLIVVGSVIGLLIFASLFVAGARLPAAVYAIPALPLAGIVLTLLPSTARWSRRG